MIYGMCMARSHFPCVGCLAWKALKVMTCAHLPYRRHTHTIYGNL